MKLTIATVARTSVMSTKARVLKTARINLESRGFRLFESWYLRRVDFRKTYYILPNLFTLSSVFCGFISISLSASTGEGGRDLYQAALAICFGFFFDTADGRVARLTKTQTDLGRDLDSLADLVTFGVAPAMLVYKWGLTDFGRIGIFVAGLFVCAGAMRLARFNVLSRREEAAGHKKPGKYTLGLSIPAAASVLVLMVIVAHNAGQYRRIGEGFVAGIVLVLSYLMVSRIRFRSFKDLSFNRKTVGLFLLAAGCAVAVIVNGVDKAFIFLLLITAYIVLGLTETVIFIKRSLVERHAARRAASAAPMVASAAARDRARRGGRRAARRRGAARAGRVRSDRRRCRARRQRRRSAAASAGERGDAATTSRRDFGHGRAAEARLSVEPSGLGRSAGRALPAALAGLAAAAVVDLDERAPDDPDERTEQERNLEERPSGAPRPVANARCMPPSSLCAP